MIYLPNELLILIFTNFNIVDDIVFSNQNYNNNLKYV